MTCVLEPFFFLRFVEDFIDMTDSGNIITEDRFARARRHLATNSGKCSGLPTISANHFLAETSALHRVAAHRFHETHPGIFRCAPVERARPVGGDNHLWRKFVTKARTGTQGESLHDLSARWQRTGRFSRTRSDIKYCQYSFDKI